MKKAELKSVSPVDPEIDSPKHLAHLERSNLFKQSLAESAAKFALALYEADYELSRREIISLCDEVGIPHDGSTFRKWIGIGKNYSRLEPFLDRLPGHWTTLSKLVALPADKYNLVTQSGRLNPFMTAKELDEMVSDRKVRVKKKADVSLDLGGLDESIKANVYRELAGLEKRFGFKLIASDQLKKIASTFQIEQVA